MTGQGNQAKTSRWKDQFTNVVSYDSEVYSIIVPLSKDIRLTFEDIYKQVLYFESLFYELIETDQQFVWDIYLSQTNEYRKEAQQKDSVYSSTQQYKILTGFLPPYIWVARAEAAGVPELEFIFDATAIPYSSDFCTSILFFDEVLEGLLSEALVDQTDNDRDSLIHVSGMNRLLKESFDLSFIWSFLKKNLDINKLNTISETENALSGSEEMESITCKQTVDSNKSSFIEDTEETKPNVASDSEEKHVPSSSMPTEFDNTEKDSPTSSQDIGSKKRNWKKKIAAGEIEPVLKEVQEFLEDSEALEDQTNVVIALISRYNRLKHNQIIGNLNFSQYGTESNRITNALLKFIDSL